jgi:hypothetical protein
MPATAPSKPGSVQRESQAAATGSSINSDRSSPQQNEGTSQEDIAKLAYALWQRRGCPEGSPENDWIEAEQQLYQSNTK